VNELVGLVRDASAVSATKDVLAGEKSAEAIWVLIRSSVDMCLADIFFHDLRHYAWSLLSSLLPACQEIIVRREDSTRQISSNANNLKEQWRCVTSQVEDGTMWCLE
jgi:hypothetical protein